MSDKADISVLRELTKQYAEIAARPIQQERRELWRRHLSLQKTRPLVLATYGMWNVWCREVFGDAAMKCVDPFFREHERTLRMFIFQDSVGDDFILEPWLDQRASLNLEWRNYWGVSEGATSTGVEGGAWKFDPPIKEWSDVAKLRAPRHCIDEEATRRNVQRIGDAVGDILPINLQRGPACQGFRGDISTSIAGLRGLEQLMIDMYESPEELHKLLAFMRDGILANIKAAEDAGDWGLTDQENQEMTYSTQTLDPKPNVNGVKLKQLWWYCAAQEFTLISPAMHDEFLLQYQLPMIKQFGLCAYGCCEDLTRKIDMLRQIPNLRIIAVTPRADVRRCAEQIGKDYVISWRPNPADMVCCTFDEGRIRKIIGEGMAAAGHLHTHIHLKDVETVEGDPTRLARWVKMVREISDKYV